MRYLLDTGWAVFSLRGRRDVAERIRALRGEGLAISTITLAELFTGVHRSKDPRQAGEGLRRFLRRVAIFPFPEEISERFGQENARLLTAGQPLDPFDLAIAATALRYGLTLLTENRKHYERVSGLELESLKTLP
jgi:tRNA(fMet)-specific endonuclease VapC